MNFLSFFRKTAPPQQATPPQLSQTDLHAIDIMARTLWGEARGEQIEGIEAVANVILNRVRHAQARGSFWWGNSISQVCLKPYQFSCWNKDDSNHPKLLAVTDSTPSFRLCLDIAERAVKSLLSDNTKGATHYHTNAILPYWAKGEQVIAAIGRHLFYRLV